MFNRLFPHQHWPDGRVMTAKEESEHWIVECPECEWESNVAAIGGTRYRARGTKRSRMLCPNCSARRWMTITWRQPSSG